MKAEARPKRIRVPVHGVLLLDKPAGLSSNDALIKAKRLLNAEKAGHTGTLDPFATGLLPLCFGEATKVSQFLLDANKRYRARIRFGAATTTYDAEGEVTHERPVKHSRAELDAALRRFIGPIAQVPPMFSALKHAGQPLYRHARAGREIERAPRPVHIHALHVLQCESDGIEIDVACSKGTYIRSLAHDLGEVLGCGAHLAALERTALGPFRLAQAQALEQLTESATAATLLPADAALPNLPLVRLEPERARALCQGRSVPCADPIAGLVRVYAETGAFLGIAAVADGALAARRLCAMGDGAVDGRPGA